MEKSIQLKAAAWRKASAIPGKDPDVWRRDDFGNEITWPEHGNRMSPYGWEIDHIFPVSRGGLDVFPNVRALHWRNNVRRGNGGGGGLMGGLRN